MKNKQAFTLIELLVVVLIIGILAAVAVPQYQKAVYKSRYATLKNLTESLAKAQEVYYLENGKYATNFEDLIVNIPKIKEDFSPQPRYIYRYTNTGYCGLDNTTFLVFCRNSSIKMAYYMGLHFASKLGWRGKKMCFADDNDVTTLRAKVCMAETGLAAPSYADDHVEFFYP